jgi:hypothetical protein
MSGLRFRSENEAEVFGLGLRELQDFASELPHFTAKRRLKDERGILIPRSSPPLSGVLHP